MGIFNPPSSGGGGGGGGVTSVNTRTGAVTLAASDILSGTFDIARIPVVPSQKQVVSSGTIANLTTAQQTEIGQGTIVTTTDGRRWVYTGTGSKILEASYITLADVSPDWNAIDNKPNSFTPSAHASSHGIGGLDLITPSAIGAAGTAAANTFTQAQIISGSSASAMLRVTQEGAGEALRIEDSNPDTTPFVVNSNGKVGIGTSPDASVGLKLDSTGVKFDDGTIQTTASTGGGTPANVQVFSAIGAFSWTKPPNAKSVHIALISGGGGGGSGQMSAASSPASGGGGGGGGARNFVILSASLLGNSENGNVGAGGAGGASVTSVGIGNNGLPGSASNFGLWAYADRGGNGAGGTAGTGGSAGSGGGRAIFIGGTGANGSPSGAGTNAGGNTNAGGGGGGGGGTSGVSAGTGGTGGLSTLYNGTAAAPAAGANGPDVPINTPLNASGGGGGSASFTAPAMAGGNGGLYGAGGGGGGGGSGFASGKGGNGSQGIVVVTTYF